MLDIEQIYRDTAPKLQSYLVGHGCSYATACDIVQETFLTIWKKKDGLIDDPHKVNGLIYTIARNCRNTLMRKAKHEVFASQDEDGEVESIGEEDMPSSTSEESYTSHPVEEVESANAIRYRLKQSLDRMPVELLEIFALSRLGKSMSVKDIATGTGTSESNVKVRVHRAKDLLKKAMCGHEASQQKDNSSVPQQSSQLALLKAVMMLAAVDGEIAKEELALYREVTKEIRNENATAWAEAVKAMAYVGFLSEMVEPAEIVNVFAHEVGRSLSPDDISLLKQMAEADSNYSKVERDCIAALETTRD